MVVAEKAQPLLAPWLHHHHHHQAHFGEPKVSPFQTTLSHSLGANALLVVVHLFAGHKIPNDGVFEGNHAISGWPQWVYLDWIRRMANV